MSIRAYYDVWCDVEGKRCVGWAEGATAMEYEGKRIAWKRAAALGWRQVRPDKNGPRLHACPNCFAELNDTPNREGDILV